MTRQFHCPRVLLEDGWHENQLICCDAAGYIREIRPGSGERAESLNGSVLPGMVNVHSHIHQRLIAGLTGQRGLAQDSFWSWRERMYDAVALLDGEAFETLAAYAFMELLEGGYTTIGEFHYPHRLGGQTPVQTAAQLIAAADRAGCGLTLLPVWYRHGGFGRQPLGESQRRFALGLEEIEELVGRLRRHIESPLHQIGVAPHSLRAVDIADLGDMLERIAEGPVHIHISEQPAEVEACIRHHGCRPIELLYDRITVDGRWCLIHATHASDAELALMAASDAVVGLCPSTEADLGDGLFPADRLLAQGGLFAIGSDSNLVTAAAEELRLLEWGQRLQRHERNVLCAPGESVATAMWQQAARSGARAVQQPVGRLAIGCRADFLVLDDSHPMLAGLPGREQLDSFVFASQAGMIDQVWVGGRQRVAGGRHPGRDDLVAEVARLRRRLVASGGHR